MCDLPLALPTHPTPSLLLFPLMQNRSHTHSLASPSWGRQQTAFCNREWGGWERATVTARGSDSIWLVRCWLARLTGWLTRLTDWHLRQRLYFTFCAFWLKVDFLSCGVDGVELGWWLLFSFSRQKNWWQKEKKKSTLVCGRAWTIQGKNSNNNNCKDKPRRLGNVNFLWQREKKK